MNITIKYLIGANGLTKNYDINNEEVFLKQKNISIPLITGAKIQYKSKKNFNIFVGKEINLQKIFLEKYKIKKYNLDLEQLANLALRGYKRACLLSYKKYDQVIVGMNNEDITVPDYFTFKKLLYLISLKANT